MEKATEYYRYQREDLFNLLPSSQKLQSVLDIGCAAGYAGQYLKKRFQIREIVGVEINEDVAKLARQRIDKVIVGDIEAIKLPYEKWYFDLIIFADVLEHLYNPWHVLESLIGLLRYDGYILASIPNVQLFSIIWNLLKGKWEYEHEGPMDIDHLRFFTKQSIIEMFTDKGLFVEKIINRMSKRMRIVNIFLLNLFPGFWTTQYYVLAKKAIQFTKE